MEYLKPSQLLELLPQQRPFRFIDEVTQIDNDAATCRYRLRQDEYFYAGHFPKLAVTPGVILLEIMAQAGVVIPILYRLAQEIPLGSIPDCRAYMTDAQAEWLELVLPGDCVTIRAHVRYWRKRKMRSNVEMFKEGRLVASAVIGGMAVLG